MQQYIMDNKWIKSSIGQKDMENPIDNKMYMNL